MAFGFEVHLVAENNNFALRMKTTNLVMQLITCIQNKYNSHHVLESNMKSVVNEVGCNLNSAFASLQILSIDNCKSY